MGMLVKDRTVCPVRVRSWNDIDESAKEHMWAAVKDKFKGKDFELDRDTTLRHMKRLWHCWRGNLVQHYIKPAGSYEKALEKVPKNMLPEDWKWLLEEHFFNEEFLKIRQRNSENRGNLSMLHHTGSMPFRQIIFEKLGGKEGKMPTVAEVFKETRQLKSGALDEESADKLEEIIQTSKDNPHYSAFELVEECFGPQDRDHVACFGYGMRPKDVRGPLPTRAALQSMLREKEKQNAALHMRMDDMEDAHKNAMDQLQEQVRMLANLVMGNQQTSTNSTANTDEDDV